MMQKYIKNGQSLKIDAEKCSGCGACREVCPHGVFKIENKKAVIINRDYCMECGACKMNCSFKAIEVNTGVGCAYAIISGLINKTAPSCGCSGDKGSKSGSCCG